MSRSPRAAALAAALCATVAFTPMTRAAVPLPGDDDVQQLLDGQDYAKAEAALDRLLACRGAAAEHNDRSRDYQMLVQCQLALNQPAKLAKTLKAAVEKAEADDDPAALAVVAPLELLRRAAIDGAYRPRADRRAKYDLADADPKEGGRAAGLRPGAGLARPQRQQHPPALLPPERQRQSGRHGGPGRRWHQAGVDRGEAGHPGG